MILHTYSEKHPEQQEETLDFIELVRVANNAGVLIYPKTITSRLTTVTDDLSYWRALMDYWGKEDLIHFQQDIVPTLAMLDALLVCPYAACTYPHKLRTGFGLYKPIYDSASYTSYMPVEMHWYYPPYPKFVEASGIALCKISKELQQQIPLANYSGHWSNIDMWISCFMDIELSQRWHVHAPEVKHNHF